MSDDNEGWVYFDARDALRAHDQFPDDEWQWLYPGDLFSGNPSEWRHWIGLDVFVGVKYRRRRKDG